jgi:hypothetical protein
MADASKLKKKRLGAPPSVEEIPQNLRAPEIAPSRRAANEDGRSARKTGRTVQFATRVTETFDRQFRAVAKRDGLLLSKLLEEALKAYEKR